MFRTTAHRSAGGDRSRGRVAPVKPGLPATAFGGKGLTRASTPALVPPCVRRWGGAGSPISTHSFFKRGASRDLEIALNVLLLPRRELVNTIKSTNETQWS